MHAFDDEDNMSNDMQVKAEGFSWMSLLASGADNAPMSVQTPLPW